MGSEISRATHPSREYYSCNYRNIPIGIARDTRRSDSRHVQLQDQLPVQGHDPGRVTHIIKAFY